MTIHLVGLPHTQFNSVTHAACAFTAKAVRTAQMWRSQGLNVITYWAGDEADVSLLSNEKRDEFFGVYDPAELPVVVWNPHLPYWIEFNDNAILEIEQRIETGDIVAVVGGSISQDVVDHFVADYTCIEPGVGYEGGMNNTFACFESYAWMHSRYGAWGVSNGRPFDAVIPNAVDPKDWHIAESKGYALFVGRLVARKGPHVAAQIANAAGLKLLVAGAGVDKVEPNKITATDGTEIVGDVEYAGVLLGDERANLFAEAEVLICPTLYIEPWGGVHAEAMMSGVGVIAPDYGVFTETLPLECRYHTLGTAVRAITETIESRGEYWREYATALAGIDRCAELYKRWIDRLTMLRDGSNGWYGDFK